MKKLMRRMALSITTATVLTIAVIEAATPTGVNAQVSARCEGDEDPICATVTSCKGIMWWRECLERSYYWELSPPLNGD